MEILAKNLCRRFSRRNLLTHENHVAIWPFADHRPFLSDKRGPLFSLSEGWSILGWCEAPFRSSRDYNDALVLEYDGLPRRGHACCTESTREAGVYWIHCRLDSLKFLVDNETKT